MTLATGQFDLKTVGILGLGRVGGALAQRLAAHGHDCVGWDIDPAALHRFQSLGHVGAANPAHLGDLCAVVICAAFDTAGLVAAWEAPAEGLSSGRALRFVIDCSTGDPSRIEALAADMLAREVGLVEAPLSGSSTQIAAGEATALVAGADAHVAAVMPVLQAITPRQHRVGDVGMGARAKLATNLVLGLNRAALAEGMVLAERLGLSRALFLQLVLDSPARSDAASVKGHLMVEQRFEPAQSRVVQHLKDVDLMLALARELGQGLPLTERHAELLRRSVAAGDADLDNAAVVRQIGREQP